MSTRFTEFHLKCGEIEVEIGPVPRELLRH